MERCFILAVIFHFIFYLKNKINFKLLKNNIFIGDWGLGIGDWGLGIGD